MISMKSFLAIFLSIGLLPTSAMSEAGVFHHPTTDLSFPKPKGWNFMTADENLENLKKTNVGNKDFQKQMEKYATAPIVVITKHKEPFADLNPSVKVNIKPLGSLDGSKPNKILEMILPALKQNFKDYKLVKGPESTTVSGKNASYAMINYTLTAPGGQSFPTTSELWIVPRGEYFFVVGAGSRQDEKTGKRTEIHQIVKSIKL